jgi:hypothetical protein
MKRILIILAILTFSFNAWAASSIVAATGTRGGVIFEAPDGSRVVLKLTCTAHTDGTFDNKTLDSSVITAKTKFGTYYYDTGYYIGDVYAVNSATDDHTSGAVTITDETTRQLMGSSAGDTLTLSTTASGVGYLSVTRGATQRSVNSPLVIAVSDTGSTAVVFTLYIELVK